MILAAGRGSRMGNLTDTAPKGMVAFNGKTLIEWQIASLHGAGIFDIAIVTGYKKECISFDGIHTFHNPYWSKSNMVFSLCCASEWLEDESVIISYSDIFYSSDAVFELKGSTMDISILYDVNWYNLWSRRFPDPLLDAETFKINSQSILLEIGKKTSNYQNIEGQYMGLIKLTPIGWKTISDYISELPKEDVFRLDITSLLQNIIALSKEINAVPTHRAWGEVDSQNDLNLYKKMYSEGCFPWM